VPAKHAKQCEKGLKILRLSRISRKKNSKISSGGGEKRLARMFDGRPAFDLTC
jgi:hypothetical protein